MKQVRRSVNQILFSLTLVMVFFINIHPVMAQEISNESKNAIWNEFEEKREIIKKEIIYTLTDYSNPILIKYIFK